MPPRPVILDTNFLLLPFQFKINILEELAYLVEENHEYLISSRTLSELRRLGKSVGKDGMAARLAIKMIEANKQSIRVVESEVPVDDWLVERARKTNAVICTNDAALRKRLRPLKGKVITLKSRSRLGFV